MNYPFSAYSWTLLSRNVVVKSMDKSTFLHRGTGVPKEIVSFFELPESGISEPKPVMLKVGDVQYNAHFQMDEQFDRVRLFWKSDLSSLIKKRFPKLYNIYSSGQDDTFGSPQMRFSRLRRNVYSVEFLDPHTPATEWPDEELDAAISAYFQMLNKELIGESYNKSKFNRELRDSTLSNRTKGSVEFRMQNISAVLQSLCHPIIQGYLPRGNVGTEVSERIKNIIFRKLLLHEEDYSPTSDDEELDNKVTAILKKGLSGKPSGQSKTARKNSSHTIYERDPLIKAWVLNNANGKCELCDEGGPFRDKNGRLFLEVHHVVSLAQSGSDTVTNTVALCPNCHRKVNIRVDFFVMFSMR